MASYQGHLSCSAALGAAYGGLGAVYLNADWGLAFLAGGVTALGGLLPDLDSDSGVPVRELFGLMAATIPLLLFSRLRQVGFTIEQTLALLAAVYLGIRYGLAELFKRFTVHRGMFHSIPAMLIVGLLVFLIYQPPVPWTRYYLVGGVMLGFLSHLVLDELYSVDFMGATIRLKGSAGSALKFYSSDWTATASTYMYLAGLAFAAWMRLDHPE
jgi:hypothetical protein